MNRIIIIMVCLAVGLQAGLKHKSTNREYQSGLKGETSALAYSPDGSLIAIASENSNAVIVLDTATAAMKYTLKETKPSTPLPISIGEKNDFEAGIVGLHWVDGNTLLATYNNRTCKVWDIANQKIISSFTNSVINHSSSLSTDKKFFAVAGGSLLSGKKSGLSLFQLDSKKVTAEFSGVSTFHSVDISPSGSLVAGHELNGIVTVWKTVDASTVRAISFGSCFGFVKFHPNEKQLIASVENFNMKLFDISNGIDKVIYAGHTNDITSFAVHQSGAIIASVGKDSTIRIWNTATGEELTSIMTAAIPYGISFSPGGTAAAISFENGRIQVLNVTHYLSLAEPKKVVTPADSVILPRSIRGITEAFSLMKEKPYLMIENSKHTGRVKSVTVTSDGKEIVTASYDKTMRVWDAETGEFIRVIRVPAFPGPEGRMYDMAVSDNKQYIINAGWSVGSEFAQRNSRYIGDYVMVQDYATGAIVGVNGAHDEAIQSVAISADGKRILSGDSKVVLSEWKGGKLVTKKIFNMFDIQKQYCNNCPQDEFNAVTMNFTSYIVTGLTFMNNSKDFFAVNQHGVLVRFHVDSKENITHSLIGESNARKQSHLEAKAVTAGLDFTALGIDPTGKYAVVGDKFGNLYVFDANGDPSKKTANGSIEKLIRKTSTSSEGWVGGVSFNKTGTQVAIAISKDVYVFEMPMLKRISKFSMHDNSVQSVAFHPDGKRVISSGGNAHQVYVWDAATGKLSFELGGTSKGTRILELLSHKTNPNVIIFGLSPNFRAFDLEKLSLVPVPDREMVFPTMAADPMGFREDVFSGRLLCSTKLPDGTSLYGMEHMLRAKKNGQVRMIGEVGIEIRSLAACSDSATFFAGLDDGRIQIFDTRSSMLIATLYVSPSNEWILWTPEGYYTGSKNGSRLVGWLVNEGLFTTPKFYPFEQFDVRLNRPDLVLMRLGGVQQGRVSMYHKAYQKRLKRLGMKEEDLSEEMNAPQITVPPINPIAAGKSVKVKITAVDSLFPLTRLNISVNDVPIFGIHGKALTAPARKKYTSEIPVELNYGRNKIQISVMNERGVESLKETYYTHCSLPEKKSDLYVIAVGVSEYFDFNYNLTYAAKDAGDLVATLQSHGAAYNKVHAYSITNTQATKENILAMKKALQKSSVDDHVVLFFAGHGLLDNNLDYYLATSNIDFPAPSQRGLAYDELEGLLDGIPARKKLLLIDACHSGEIDKDESALVADTAVFTEGVKPRGFKKVVSKTDAPSIGLQNSFELMQQLFSDVSSGSGTIVISSAGGKEFAFESGEWKNGVFTYSLLGGLKTYSADKNSDKKITVNELKDYVIQKVQELTGGKQTPTSRKENVVNDFKVW